MFCLSAAVHEPKPTPTQLAGWLLIAIKKSSFIYMKVAAIQSAAPPHRHQLHTRDTMAPESCAICLSNFSCHTDRVYLPCGHPYHRHCVTQWIRTCRQDRPPPGVGCPVCRGHFDVTETLGLHQPVQPLLQPLSDRNNEVMRDRAQFHTDGEFTLHMNLRPRTLTGGICSFFTVIMLLFFTFIALVLWCWAVASIYVFCAGAKSSIILSWS